MHADCRRRKPGPPEQVKNTLYLQVETFKNAASASPGGAGGQGRWGGGPHTQGAGGVALGMPSFTSVPVTGAAGGELSPSSPSLVPVPAPMCVSSPQPLCIPLPWVLGGFRVTMGARRARGPCHAQGTPTVVSGICKAVIWMAPPVPPQCSWALGGSGRGEGVQVGARAEPETWGLGKPQDCLSLRDWRLAWKGWSEEGMLRDHEHDQAPCWDLLLPWHPRDNPPFPHGLHEPRAGVGGALG